MIQETKVNMIYQSHQKEIRESAKQNYRCILRRLRDQRDLLQGDISALTGIPEGTLSHIEQGKQFPRWYQMIRLRDALGLSVVDQLFERVSA